MPADTTFHHETAIFDEKRDKPRLPPIGSLVRDPWGGCFGLARTYRVKEHFTNQYGHAFLVCTQPDGGPVGWNGLQRIPTITLIPAMVKEIQS